jgi:Ca-activated chloride channel family protein
VSQKRPNLFTTRVANVGPGEQVEVVLEYQQTLAWDSGSFRLRFPMTITPRYTPHGLGDLPRLGLAALSAAAQGTWTGAVAAAQSPAAPNPSPAVVPASAEESEIHGCFEGAPPPETHPLRLTVELDAGFPLESLTSSHHDFDVELVGPGSGSGDRYRIRLLDEKDNSTPEVEADRDFELLWTPVVGAEPRSALFTEEIGGDVYALLMVLPPDPETPGFSRLPRETIFVIDTSGSMGGASIEQAKAALTDALGRLEPEDSFNILAFNSTTRALFPGSWPADPASVERARAWVRSLSAGGGTEMLPALLAALDRRPDGYGRTGARAVKQVIFITDGAVSNENQLFSAIERHLGDARLFPVGIGSAPNGHFMQRAAALGRGTATFIGNPWEVGSRMGELFAKLESPALTGLDVVWDDPGAEMYPPRIPDLYAGEPVVVAARLLSLGDEIRVSGERDGSFWEASFATRAIAAETVTSGTAASATTAPGTVTAAAGALRTPSPPGLPGGGPATAGIGKLWARRAIAALMDEHRRAPGPAPGAPETPERDEIRRRVVELALAHHLVSPFTSLVAVDVTPSRPAGERLERRSVPNAVPAGSTGAFGQLPMGATGSRLYLLAGLGLLGAALVLAALRLAAPSRRRRRGGWGLAGSPLGGGSAAADG